MDPLVIALSIAALAQPAPSQRVELQEHLTAVAVHTPDEHVVASTVIDVPGAAWLRLEFTDAHLAGDPAGRGSIVRIMSLHDGAVQELTAEGLAWWGRTSAYFNGSRVAVDLISRGSEGDNTLTISAAWVGQPGTGEYESRSLCGIDDRLPSSDAATARYMPTGCTAWLFDDANHTFLTAGHCFVGSTGVAEFNVPLSLTDGTLVHPPPRDQYPVEPGSVQSRYLGLGEDWSYFGCFPSTQTGLTAFQSQRTNFVLSSPAWASPGEPISVTGYGNVAAPVSLTWYSVQKSCLGPFAGVSGQVVSYATDTTTGNSGSPVARGQTRQAIAIHTNAGCTTDAGFNQGTSVLTPSLQEALANPRGICRSGVAAPTGMIFAIGDANNNFGVVNESTGGFGQLAQIASSMQGLAYDRNEDRLFAVSFDRDLYQVNPFTGTARLLGRIMGNPAPITGLGFDPDQSVLWGISQSDGRLWTVSPETLWARVVGGALGGNIGGIEFDPVQHVLYGLDDTATGTVLVRFDTTTGVRTTIGPLGPGITDCNGLAYAEDGWLYTINAGTDLLFRIDPATGAASAVGPTGALFGSGYGMTGRLSRTGCARFDFNHDGNLDQDDVALLIQVLSTGQWEDDPDLTGDGNADADDVAALIQVVAGGGC